MVAESRIELLSQDILRGVGRDHPDCTVAEMMSAIFTVARGLVAVVLESQNDEWNRSQILRCLSLLEQDVWAKSPVSPSQAN